MNIATFDSTPLCERLSETEEALLASRISSTDISRLADWQVLHRAVDVEATDLITLFIIDVLPSVINNPDRYGHREHPFDTEVPPLLKLLIGSRLEHFNSFSEFTAAMEQIESAIDAAEMCLIPVAQEISDFHREQLRADFESVVKQMRDLGKKTPKYWGSNSNGGMIHSLSLIGRLRHASHLAAKTPFIHDLPALARSWRLIRAYDRALLLAERMVEMDPAKTIGYTMRGAILADMGENVRAHKDARRGWVLRKNEFTARLLARTSKNVDDSRSFAEAIGFLGTKEVIGL